MSQISIVDLEVCCCVGVPEEERAQPQRLLLTVEMELDFSKAVAGDEIAHTVDYYTVVQRLLGFGKDRSWKLIETLSSDLAAAILAEFKPDSVSVEVKKFVIPEARCVSARVSRRRTPAGHQTG